MNTPTKAEAERALDSIAMEYAMLSKSYSAFHVLRAFIAQAGEDMARLDWFDQNPDRWQITGIGVRRLFVRDAVDRAVASTQLGEKHD